MNQFIKNLFNVANEMGYTYSYDPVRLIPFIQLIEEVCITYLVEVEGKDTEEWSSNSNIEELDAEHAKYYLDVFEFYKDNLNDVLKEYSYFNV